METVRTSKPRTGKGPVRVFSPLDDELPEWHGPAREKPRAGVDAGSPAAAWHEPAPVAPRSRSRGAEYKTSPYPFFLLVFVLPLALLLGGTVLVDLFWP